MSLYRLDTNLLLVETADAPLAPFNDRLKEALLANPLVIAIYVALSADS